jgi:hypothetical protein
MTVDLAEIANFRHMLREFDIALYDEMTAEMRKLNRRHGHEKMLEAIADGHGAEYMQLVERWKKKVGDAKAKRAQMRGTAEENQAQQLERQRAVDETFRNALGVHTILGEPYRPIDDCREPSGGGSSYESNSSSSCDSSSNSD